MLKENDIILVNGKEFVLGKKLGGGTEGTTFELAGEKYAVKIINENRLTEVQKKLLYQRFKNLVRLRKDSVEQEKADKRNAGEKEFKKIYLHKILSLPKFLLDDQLGYIMKKIDNAESVSAYLYSGWDKNTDFDEWYKVKNLKRRYQIAEDLFRNLRELHYNGLIFTDISPNNIMFDKTNNNLQFIDVDNIRVRNDPYVEVIGTTGYIAPEVLRKGSYKSEDDPKKLANLGRLTFDSDIFSAAVLSFEILTLQHPFIGDEVEEGPVDLEEKALNIETDYILKEGTTNTSSSEFITHIDDILTDELKKLFERTFVDGKNQPSLRPTSDEFIEAFQKAKDLLINCSCGYSRILSSKKNNTDSNNLCINCEKKIDKNLVLKIYFAPHKMDTASLINLTCDYDECNVSSEYIVNNKNIPLRSVVIGSTLSEEPIRKILYTHHIGIKSDIDSAIAEVILEPNGEITLRNLKGLKNSFHYISKGDRERKLEDKETVKWKGLYVLFEVITYGKVTIKVIGKFVEE